MEPRIKYAHTADGLSIAYWTLGEGIPLVHMTGAPFTHAQLEWRLPMFRNWYDRVMTRRKVIRFDPRGCGMSERKVSDFSLDAQTLDLEAVLDRLALESCVLIAFHSSGPLAISYAVAHPERVSHLVLWESYARAADRYETPQMQGFLALLHSDWYFFTETLAHVYFGWEVGEPAQQFAKFVRECVTQEAARAFFAAQSRVDVSHLLERVSQPTLVLEHKRPDMDVARQLASRIPDARLVVLEGRPVEDKGIADAEAALDELLGEAPSSVTAEQARPHADFRTILFTDVVGSTDLVQRLGDTRAREVLRQHERIVRDALRAYGGSEVKTMGDGFLASFSSASRALECSIAIQRALETWNAQAGMKTAPSPGAVLSRTDAPAADIPVSIRIGLNAGEPLTEENDLFGASVILASRIAAQAGGGQILAANVVRELCAGKGFLFADHGEAALRGFEDPVRLYEVRWREP